jgi:molybdenum cofactor cytidylyltransferase
MPFRIVLPAAGAASRMRGGDKLLELVDGLALLRRQAGLACEVCTDVVVTLRPGDAARRGVLQGLAIRVIEVADASEGMAASIRAGVAGAMGAVMVLPSDMPEIDAQDLRTLIEAFDQAPEAIWRGASAEGVAGHPVIFPADLLPQLQTISGDAGARGVIGQHRERVRLCPLPAAHALTDLDTPEDWQRWRALRR